MRTERPRTAELGAHAPRCMHHHCMSAGDDDDVIGEKGVNHIWKQNKGLHLCVIITIILMTISIIIINSSSSNNSKCLHRIYQHKSGPKISVRKI